MATIPQETRAESEFVTKAREALELAKQLQPTKENAELIKELHDVVFAYADLVKEKNAT